MFSNFCDTFFPTHIIYEAKISTYKEKAKLFAMFFGIKTTPNLPSALLDIEFKKIFKSMTARNILTLMGFESSYQWNVLPVSYIASKFLIIKIFFRMVRLQSGPSLINYTSNLYSFHPQYTALLLSKVHILFLGINKICWSFFNFLGNWSC